MSEIINAEQSFNENILISFFKNIERQGPGSDDETRKALQFIVPLNSNSTILDIGCGTGQQTMVLANTTTAKIIATDLSIDLLQIVTERTRTFGSRVSILEASMDSLPLPDNQIDLIWAEGCAYVLGFEQALRSWYRLLKVGGMIAVSEISWLTETRPQEVEDYWKTNYPSIKTISENIQILGSCGYKTDAHFTIAEEAWTINYYDHIKTQIREYEVAYKGNEQIEQFLQTLRDEIDIYDRYKNYFGYVFYIGTKI